MEEQAQVFLPTSLEEVFAYVVEFAQHLFAFPVAAFVDLTPEKRKLRIRLREPVGEELISAFKQKTLVSVRDFSALSLKEDEVALDLRGSVVNKDDTRKLKSYFACPTAIDERTTAVIAFGSNQPAAFSAGSIQLVTALADHYSKFLSSVNAAVTEVRHKAEMQLAEEKLRTERQLVEKLRKFDELRSGFISMVSHELRTPMTAIKSSIQLILDGTAGPVTEEQEKWLTMAMRNIDRLSDLIHDVLDISKIERGSLKLDLNMHRLQAVAEEVVASLQHKASEKDSTVELGEFDNSVECYFDRNSITQVLTNLVGNGVAHNPPGTHVTVSLDDVNDILATVCVSDNGRGLPAEQVERIFDKFYQVEKSLGGESGGTGLGLAISKGIIDAHSGRIWCESTPGIGSSFRFSIPRAPESIGKIVPPSKPRADSEILFGKIAVLLGYGDESQVEECVRLQAQSSDPKSLGDIMTNLGILSREQCEEVLRVQKANLNRPSGYDPVRTLADILLGRLAVRFKYLNQKQVNECVRIQASRQVSGKYSRLGEIFVQKGFLRFVQVLDLLSLQGITVTECSECGEKTNIFYYSPANEYWCRHCGGKLLPLQHYAADAAPDL